MPKITFVNEHRILEAETGCRVYDVARENGIALDVSRFRGFWSCGGRGLCRGCLCWIDESAPGAAGPRSMLEKMRGLRGWQRLACRTHVVGDIKVHTVAAAAARIHAPQREIAPAPTPTVDPSAPRKPLDAASTAEHVRGHPSMLGRGTREK